MMTRTAFFVLLFPLTVLVLGLVLFVRQIGVPLALGSMLSTLPYLLGIATIVIGWWFKSPRVVLTVILITATHWAINTFVPDLEHAGANTRELMVIYAAIAVLFPINGFLMAFLSDHGMTSKAAIGRVLFVAVQIIFLLVIWDAGLGAGTWVDEAFHARILPTFLDYWSLLPQPAILLFAVASVVLFSRAIFSGNIIDGGLFGAVSMTGFALHSAGQGHLPHIMFSLACLTLLVAMVQESYRLAYIDELTNLPGRRALMHDLKAAGKGFSVAMLDVDHFKKFNDTYGHDVGDQVLKLVASRMMKVSGGGRAFRYGGEEFTVLFPRASAKEAKVHLDKLRQAIADASFNLRDQDRPKAKPESPRKGTTKGGAKTKAKSKNSDTVSVTISIGVAGVEPGQTADEALKTADQALYRAKDSGRNRVSL